MEWRERRNREIKRRLGARDREYEVGGVELKEKQMEEDGSRGDRSKGRQRGRRRKRWRLLEIQLNEEFHFLTLQCNRESLSLYGSGPCPLEGPTCFTQHLSNTLEGGK